MSGEGASCLVHRTSSTRVSGGLPRSLGADRTIVVTSGTFDSVSSSMPMTHRDLVAWQLGMELAQHCYQVVGHLPLTERYGLRSQITRAAVSVPANIAEGFGRESRREFARFLAISAGSLKELETHLELCRRCGLSLTLRWRQSWNSPDGSEPCSGVSGRVSDDALSPRTCTPRSTKHEVRRTTYEARSTKHDVRSTFTPYRPASPTDPPSPSPPFR